MKNTRDIPSISWWDAEGLTSQRLKYTCFTYQTSVLEISHTVSTHQLHEYLLYKLPLFFTPIKFRRKF